MEGHRDLRGGHTLSWPDFQVIRSVDGVSSTGARATLDGMADLAWPAEAWETDPAAMDGALQLAMLCGLQTIGQTLPLRIGGMGYTGSTVISPIYCSLLVRSQSPERVVCDITLVGSDGAPVADWLTWKCTPCPVRTRCRTCSRLQTY